MNFTRNVFSAPDPDWSFLARAIKINDRLGETLWDHPGLTLSYPLAWFYRFLSWIGYLDTASGFELVKVESPLSGFSKMIYAARFFVYLFDLAYCWLFYFVVSKISKFANLALLIALLMAGSVAVSTHLYFVRTELITSLFYLAGFFVLVRGFLKNQSEITLRDCLLSGFFLGLALMTKVQGFILLLFLPPLIYLFAESRLGKAAKIEGVQFLQQSKNLRIAVPLISLLLIVFTTAMSHKFSVPLYQFGYLVYAFAVAFYCFRNRMPNPAKTAGYFVLWTVCGVALSYCLMYIDYFAVYFWVVTHPIEGMTRYSRVALESPESSSMVHEVLGLLKLMPDFFRSLLWAGRELNVFLWAGTGLAFLAAILGFRRQPLFKWLLIAFLLLTPVVCDWVFRLRYNGHPIYDIFLLPFYLLSILLSLELLTETVRSKVRLRNFQVVSYGLTGVVLLLPVLMHGKYASQVRKNPVVHTRENACYSARRYLTPYGGVDPLVRMGFCSEEDGK